MPHPTPTTVGNQSIRAVKLPTYHLTSRCQPAALCPKPLASILVTTNPSAHTAPDNCVHVLDTLCTYAVLTRKETHTATAWSSTGGCNSFTCTLFATTQYYHAHGTVQTMA
mmetsp:Transcript_6800/g.15056  ORF Transcript_6800/g.15056 Transcript_6800/m.15056 type:complete len:111 (-) Transcript_6800:1631-1963(-)